MRSGIFAAYALAAACGRIGFDAFPEDSLPVGTPCASDAECGPCRACIDERCERLSFALLRIGYNSSAGIDQRGWMWAWGDDEYAALGIGPPASRYAVPTRTRLPPLTHLALGRIESAGVARDGVLHRWGFMPGFPPETDASGGWSRIAGNYLTGCGIKADGSLWCWGNNAVGQLGDGTTTPGEVSLPVTAVAGGGPWVDVAAGHAHTCAIRDDATLWCWGDHTYGQLGIGDIAVQRSTPTRVDGAWSDVGVGESSTCAIDTARQLWCWGYELGGRSKLPVQISADTDWVEVAVAMRRACARKADRSVWCWGETYVDGIPENTGVTAIGQLGDELQVGVSHACVRDGTEWRCWGDGTVGQLGDGRRTSRARPEPLCP